MKIKRKHTHPPGQIMSLLDVFPDMTGLSLVFEFMPHTLYTILKNDSMPLSRSTIRSYTSMLLHGINYMHNIGIMHRVSISIDCYFPFCIFRYFFQNYPVFSLSLSLSLDRFVRYTTIKINTDNHIQFVFFLSFYHICVCMC